MSIGSPSGGIGEAEGGRGAAGTVPKPQPAALKGLFGTKLLPDGHKAASRGRSVFTLPRSLG